MPRSCGRYWQSSVVLHRLLRKGADGLRLSAFSLQIQEAIKVEVVSMSVGPRSQYVRCVGWPRCKFSSHRRADEPEEAERKPCPRCGAQVVVIQRAHPDGVCGQISYARLRV